MNEVLQARYLRDYVVHLEFDDGLQGEVDLSSYSTRGPVFVALSDPAFFARFSVEGGTLVWPNGADIAPERLYELTLSANKARQADPGHRRSPISGQPPGAAALDPFGVKIHSPLMTASAPTVYNALLRCTRDDQLAHPLFECVRRDLGLWVWELGPFNSTDLGAWLSYTEKTLRANLALLSQLGQSSADYTLHLAVNFGGPYFPLVFSSSFLEIASKAGFALEIYEAPDHDWLNANPEQDAPADRQGGP